MEITDNEPFPGNLQIVLGPVVFEEAEQTKILVNVETLTMVQVVSTLSTLRSPWNCPHGRPTMRHLVTLSALDAMRGREYGIDLAE